MCARAFSLRTHTTPYIESNLNATATTTTNNNCLYHKCLENKTKKFSSLLPSLCVYMCGLFRFFYSFYRTKSVVIVSLCVSLLSFRSCFIYDTLLLFSFSYLHLIVSRQIRFNFSIISALATSKSCLLLLRFLNHCYNCAFASFFRVLTTRFSPQRFFAGLKLLVFNS